MKKKHRLKIQREINEFTRKYLEYSNILLLSYEKIQPEIRKALPEIFSMKYLSINTFYSENRKHIMILFNNSTKNSSSFTLIKDNIFDGLDETHTWEKTNVGLLKINNGTRFIDSCVFEGGKPFEITGDNTKLTIINSDFILPNRKRIIINFGYIFSYAKFEHYLNNIEEFIQNNILMFWDFKRTFDSTLDSSLKEMEYKNHLNEMLDKMNSIFFKEKVKESIIDEFITNNPIILEKSLDIKPDSLLPQITLKNWIKENFEQDMKPDLICQNILEDWIILDYKRSKRITKKEGTARADVTSEVHELMTQIKYYREYFNEERHRDSFFQNTGKYIQPKPQGIGIIGNLPQSKRQLFLDSIEYFPNWIRIVTYNEIYKRFQNFCKNI